MHILHRQLEEDGDLRQAVQALSERIRENPLKHGLVLDLNPYWFEAYRFWSAGLDWDPYRFRSDWNLGSLLDVAQLADIPDLTRVFPHVWDLTEQAFGRPWPANFQPYLLRIQARPIRTPDPQLLERRYDLLNAAREAQIPTLVESQDPPRLVAAAGDRVLSPAGDKGTIGGFLKDPAAGRNYAVTCAHVISMGTASLTSGPLGPCRHASSPTPLPTGVACCTGCPHMTELDFALIETGSASVSNKATSIVQYVFNRQLVDMNGATSGPVQYEVGGAVVEQELDGYCWSRLFQVHAPVSASMFPVSMKVATTTLPQDGDSGAWLLRGATEWAGMIVATDALHGYALPATAILAGAEKLVGAKLDLA